jgi:phosphatidylglycerol:prolipoprotein diacylglycerol transferase
MFIAGILGARAFYVVEYWQREFSPRVTGSAAKSLLAIANVPKGGLVVYGSVLLGVPAGIWYCLKRGLAPLAIGDIIAPSMLVGLALGRVGCFLNGCCYGGVCLTAPYAMTFPAGSPPYVQHEASGWDTGIWLAERDGRIVVSYLAAPSATHGPGLKEGDEVTSINGAQVTSLDDARKKLVQSRGAVEIETKDGRVVRWIAARPPSRSVPIHPAQLYAAIDAGLLALVLWAFFPFRTRDGQVFALMLVTHPISRFLIESIRDDEPGQLGTRLTVSQWLSGAIFLAGIALWIYIERRPRGTALGASQASARA